MVFLYKCDNECGYTLQCHSQRTLSTNIRSIIGHVLLMHEILMLMMLIPTHEMILTLMPHATLAHVWPSFPTYLIML
jgi:hypothetical protein